MAEQKVVPVQFGHASDDPSAALRHDDEEMKKYGFLSSRFLGFSNSVALHIWTDPHKERFDAVTEGYRECTFNPLTVGNVVQAQQQETSLELHGSYFVNIVWKALDGNAMTLDKIQEIKEFEQQFINHADYPKYCRRIRSSVSGKSTTCEGWKSVASACNSTHYGRPCGAANAEQVGVFDCGVRSDGSVSCDGADWTINQTFMDLKLGLYANSRYQIDEPQTDFLSLTDAKFGQCGTETTARAVSSYLWFGFPLEGYTSTTDRPDDQKDKIEEFLNDVFYEKLQEYNYKSDKTDSFEIGYYGGPLSNTAISAALTQDFMLIFVAFVLVWFYVAFMSRSMFYATMAMIQIFSSFIIGFMLYRLLYFNAFFGTFHIIAIFLITGVGVDDVFVFNDTFEGAVQHNPAFQNDLHARLSYAWKQSAVAMAVTSSTTAMCFFLNAVSSFPGIAAFGVFAGSLVVIMYISMIFFWPAVVTFNEAKFKDMQFCCGLLDKCEGFFANSSIEMVTVQSERRQKFVDSASGDSAPPKPMLVRFFSEDFSSFVLTHRAKVVFVFAAVSGYMFYSVSKLEPDREPPVFFPKSHPVQIIQDAAPEYFTRGGGSAAITVNIIMGMNGDNLIDRDGKDITGLNWGDGATEKGALGVVRYNEGDDSFHTYLYQCLECMTYLCDRLNVSDPNLEVSGDIAYEPSGCWASDVRDWARRNTQTGPAAWGGLVSSLSNAAETWSWARTSKATFYNATFATSVDPLINTDGLWLQNKLLPFVFGVEHSADANQPEWKFAKLSKRLTTSADYDPVKGRELAKRWDDWLANEMNNAKCSGAKRYMKPFIQSSDFMQFVVSDSLVGEMTQGVCVSIAVAFVVLILATGNVVTGSLAAFSISMIVCWVLAMIPVMGWKLGMIENIVLVMVPGLSVDFTAHLAEAYNGAKFDDREHRVVHALEHSGVSIISGAFSTLLASGCLLFCTITFFTKFATLILITIGFAIIWSLFAFPSVMALIGPRGYFGDWHKLICPAGDKTKHTSTE